MPVFAGMQKLTLMDYPDKTACTLFVRGCNFACPFCHNPSLIALAESGDAARDGYADRSGGALTEEHILDFLQERKGMLDGVCVSGGEPLAQAGIFEFCGKLKEMGYLVKVDTNGSFPDRLKALIGASYIDYAAMDVKNSMAKYPQTIGRPGYDTAPVEESIAYLLEGKVPCEFRTTVVRQFHEPGDILSIARHISGAEKYFLQRFERPEEALCPGLDAYDELEMQDICAGAKAVLPCTVLR